jgi:hypothetical protein
LGGADYKLWPVQADRVASRDRSLGLRSFSAS